MEITFYRKIANKVADAVIDNHEYSDVDAKRIRYGLVCIFSDLYKFILFLFLFSIFSLTTEFLLAFLGIFLLRPFLAGFHAKTELACVFISFSTMVISILVGNINLLNSLLQQILIITLPMLGLIIAPVRVKKVEEKKFILKLSAFVVTALTLIIDYYLLDYQILFVSVIQIYLLTLYQLLKNYINFHKTLKISK